MINCFHLRASSPNIYLSVFKILHVEILNSKLTSINVCELFNLWVPWMILSLKISLLHYRCRQKYFKEI